MAFQHHDYTVAWICALPLEMTAAKMMLDEVHPRLSQPNSDHNAYTLGSISGHNVVVACLPSGVYGTTTAALVLAHMLETFPSLRFGLMVGIGGGVPSKDVDIRLGDVVVSMPTATSGGVVQYDYGKTMRDGRFERTGSLNKPPQYLLTAVSQMRSSPQLVTREKRDSNMTTIHYGLIASGNQVMKNAKTRDIIAQELKILCFEMEAAGLMDQLPCLVIRGVCDYCDSHKHKQWQAYAALTAAAYTKTLLEVVPRYDYGPNVHRNLKEAHHWMVPFAQNSRFAGRQQEIDRLEHLISHTSGPTKIAIHGLGGIGKTQIALELAYRIRESSTGCSVFWIPCVSYESVEQTYLNIAAALGISTTEPAKVKEQVKAYLSQGSVAKWLLIFDNADDSGMWIDGSATTPPLKNILPRSGNGHILFTSRNRRLAVKLAAPNVLSVPDSSRKTCCMTTTTANNLLEQLGFLPLAITQAAVYINEKDISLSKYLSLLKQEASSAAELLSEEFEDDARYAEIQNPQIQQLDGLAADYLSFIACINPRDIPQAILPPAPSAKKRSDALDILKAYSFIIEHPYNGLFNLHQLVHLAMRNWMRKTKVIEHWVHRTVQQLDEIFFNPDYSNAGLWRDYLSHALYLMNAEAENMQRQALKGREKVLGPKNLKTLSSMNHLGLVLGRQGKFSQAEALHRQALKGHIEALGPEDLKTLSSMNHLSLVLEGQGKCTEAELMCRKILAGYTKALGVEHTDTLSSLACLGGVLEKQSKYVEAEAMYRKTLEGFTKTLGPKHPDTMKIISYIGSVLEKQGNYKEAEIMDRKVLEYDGVAMGPEHPLNWSSMNHLGLVLVEQDKYMEAEAMYRQALKGYETALGASMQRLRLCTEKHPEGCKKALGPENPGTLASLGILGLVVEKQGKLTEAEAIYRQALEGLMKDPGPTHPATLDIARLLTGLLEDQGK
ncbi:Tetratricopeptide-like helical [Penicillium malachiteum]|uniref:Tetratricopeptide-like helical n=1 Tax=Penicillium malachiteum TaxID=1324776 RepID=UPI0025468A06|nr:Tetratricopeptide-like helical [Penicillium malachiteum]KAJ5721574.1 Tetratricopeptide-like helical [Penicillium malachiteum]